MRSEWNHISDHFVLAIFGYLKFLFALTLWTTDLHCHFCKTFSLTRPDAIDLPSQLRIVAERLMKKCIDLFFGWQVGSCMRAQLIRRLRLWRGLLLCYGGK